MISNSQWIILLGILMLALGGIVLVVGMLLIHMQKKHLDQVMDEEYGTDH